MHFFRVFVHFTFTNVVSIKIPVCRVIGRAAAGSAEHVATPVRDGLSHDILLQTEAGAQCGMYGKLEVDCCRFHRK